MPAGPAGSRRLETILTGDKVLPMQTSRDLAEDWESRG